MNPVKKKSPIIIAIVFAGLLFQQFTYFPFQKFDLKASIARGQDVYNTYCMSCHLDNGQGIEGVFPPVAKSDYLMADKKRSIDQVLHGVSGEIKVNGKVYNGEMPGFSLSNEEVSDVLNYVRNNWGNKGEAIVPSDVEAVRKSK